MPVGMPESDAFNYLTRIRQPTIMINGRFDSMIGEENIRLMFDHLGTDPKNKRLVLTETDHIPTRSDMIRETLAWLDKYLGPVQK